ncbi:MAG: flagellar basal body rod protein [Chitinophagaceae bacterium]|nr:flagellar basal body rod protein [Rubrivivax sp.]
MASTTSIALTGMQAAGTQLGVAGHNIASAGTRDFRRQTVEARTLPTGGVALPLGRASQPGAALEEDMVGLLQAKHAFIANLAVFRAHDRMLGGLLDTTV